MTSILDFLPTEMFVTHILEPYLADAKELGRISLVCRQFHRATEDDRVWLRAARNRYGGWLTDLTKAYTLERPIPDPSFHSYSTWKQVLKNDNVQLAQPVLKMKPKACFSRVNDTPFPHLPHPMYYCCIIEGIKWYREEGALAVYINVRGERDLSPPVALFACSTDRFIRGSWHPASSGEFLGHYKGCFCFDARWFEQPGEYRFCYNPLNFEYTTIFTIPPLEGVPIPSNQEVSDATYKFPFLTYLFDVKGERGLGGPVFLPLFDDCGFDRENQTPEQERAMFAKFVPEGFLERTEPTVWWV